MRRFDSLHPRGKLGLPSPRCGCQVGGFLTCVQMLMHAGLYRGSGVSKSLGVLRPVIVQGVGKSVGVLRPVIVQGVSKSVGVLRPVIVQGVSKSVSYAQSLYRESVSQLVSYAQSLYRGCTDTARSRCAKR